MPNEKPEAHYDCIVLGAGIAGITAARELKNSGKRVLILEAADYAGGRIRSRGDFVLTNDGNEVREGYPVEEGAHFIHVGKEYKEFWNEIERFGFKYDKFSKYNKVRIAFPGDQNPEWKIPKPASWAYAYDSNLNKLGKKKGGLSGSIKNHAFADGDVPAGEFVKSLGYTGKASPMAVYAISAHTPGLLTDQPAQLCPTFHSDNLCPPVNDTISTAGLKFDRIPEQIFDEFSEYRIKGPDGAHCGFSSLPLAILKEFEREEAGKIRGRILYGHAVVRVEPSNGGVRIRTGNGSEFTASSAICTFSVGMLMHKGVRIFGQFFPKEKQKVFEIIKPGPIIKFTLQFKECVWGYDHITNDSQMAILVNPTGPERKEQRTFFTSYPLLENGPFILTALMMGVDYVSIKDLDDYKAAEYLFKTVENMYNPHPERIKWDWKKMLVWKNDKEPNVLRTDWATNKWSRCGNSYISYNPDKSIDEISSARETLKNPLKTLPVFWAGEATAPAYNEQYQPLSVHGAYISGIEVAKDVARYLEKKEDVPAFETYYAEKYGRVPAEKALVAGTFNVSLSEDELKIVREYANRHTNGDIGSAIEDLLDIAIRDQA